MVLIDGIRVDLTSLLRLKHYCDPRLCKHQVSCCASYDVAISRKEVTRVVGLIPAAATYAPQLRDEAGALENPFEPVGAGEYAIDTAEDGACVFSFLNAKRERLCSLHAAALDLGLDPFKTKPSPCSLWPLALSEDTPPVLSVQKGISKFPCVWRRRGDAQTLYPDIAATVERVFGETFLEKVNAAIQTRRQDSA